MKKLTVCAAAVAAALCACGAESVTLVENGVAKCRIVVAADATRPEKFGASELKKYIKLATGAEVAIDSGEATSRRFDEKGNGNSAKIAQNGEATSRRFDEKGNGGDKDGKTIAATVRSDEDVASPLTIRISVQHSTSELREEGFILDVKPDSIDVIGADPRGALYGCYEILKRYFGMRWIAPGADCEYCVLGKGGKVEMPLGRTVHNPYLRIRTTLSGERETMLWQVRNNMQPASDTRSFFDDAKCERLSAFGRFCEDVSAGGVATSGHILSDLMLGGMDPKLSMKERGEKVLREHPDWCPLIGGKRIASYTAHSANPCVSNPELLDVMAANLVKRLRGRHTAEDYLVTIGNNDGTVWCQCEKCRALDAPEAAGTRGARSDRYWYMVNGIARRVWKELPDVTLGGWAYQDFWYAPVHVKPDPRLRVMISYNNQCWRHSVGDPNCPINRTFAAVYMSWKKLGLPIVMNRDEIGAWDGGGSPGCDFLPAESVLAKNFREYPAIGCNGSSFCVNSPYPEFSDFAKNWAPFYGNRYHWWAMWQTCYVSALAMWNRDVDWKAALEEANRLYYGAAWEPAMKRFRELLTDLFLSAPGCIGWGLGVTTGRCLDRPNSERELNDLLGKAVAAARASGDSNVVKRVLREQKIFAMTWTKARKRYVEGYREMSAYGRTGEIRIDGVLDEPDWQNADTYSKFKQSSWSNLKEIQPTYVRATYDRDTLYLAVECFEPTPDKVIAGEKVDRFATDCANLGNHVELMYSFPDMNEACWQLMINSRGQIIDSYNRSTTDRDTTIVTKAQYAVKVLKDRWIVEIAIPCTEIGQNIFDGATWKLNVARQRYVPGPDGSVEKPRIESSSAANGHFHGTANFVNVKFIPKRTGTGAHDIASWKNGNFSDHVKISSVNRFAQWRHCKSPMQPKEWSGEGTTSELRLKEGSTDDWYLHVEKGELNQYYLPTKKGKVKFTFRARGKGKIGMVLVSYRNYDDPNVRGYKQIGGPNQPSFDLTPEWKTYSVIQQARGEETERISTRFHPQGKDSWFDIDDVYVTPCE